MSIVSYLSLCLSPLGVVHVGTAAYTSCLERGWGRRKQDDSKKAWASSYMFPMAKAIRARSFTFCTVCFFSVCTGMYIYIACLTKYEECQAFCLFVWIGPPHPQASVAPPLSPRGETHSLEGDRGPNSNQGTDTLVLYVYYNPSTACQHCFCQFFMCLFGDKRNSVHEKSHGIPWNSAKFHGIIRHGIRRNSAGIAANSARNTE